MRIWKVVLGGLLIVAPLSAQEVPTLTVDAAEDPVFVRLGQEARVVAVTDPGASTEWDISFAGTSLAINGGDGGAAGVVAYCVCQNSGASDEEVQAMTPETELAEFLVVTADDAPADPSAWHPAAIAAAPWYRYNIAFQHLIWPTYNVYLLRRGDELYKVQITGYYGQDGTSRQVTFRYQALD